MTTMKDKPEPMCVDLKGLTALVTGGGTGIGRAISKGMARCGASVAVNYNRSKNDAEETVREIKEAGGQALAIQADVTDEEQVRRLIETTCSTFGGLDILMPNAGGATVENPTKDLTAAQWDADLDLNCKAVFYCVRYAVARLPDGRGRIIVTSSISARSGGGPSMVPYAAAKGAINNMIRGWAKEFAPRGITVNGIAPGVIWTRLHQKGTDPKEYKNLIKRIPLGRDGQPEDCVGPVLLLASEDGGYITGQIIEINGGMAMP